MTEATDCVGPADAVTLVLLTHNCGHRLEPILDRLLRLRMPVVAVDNGSADDTVAVLRRHRSIDVVSLDHNIGAAARTVGIERARTRYVACCDDDGWYEAAGLRRAAELLDTHPALAVVNARILVGEEERLDPISAEMAASPLPDRTGVPGAVLLSFMAGAVVVRREAVLGVGGYDRRFFIGGEEETLALPLLKAGWQLRYVPDVVMHHLPSRASVDRLRPYGLRNTLWTAWLHRRPFGALRWTAYTLLDRPFDANWIRGLAMALAGLPWVLRRRSPVSSQLEQDLRELDRRRFAESRSRWVRRWT